MTTISYGNITFTSKSNEIYYGNKKIQKFKSNILYFSVVHNDQIHVKEETQDLSGIHLLACDNKTIKLFTLDQTLHTERTSSNITDITYSTSGPLCIFFSSLKGLFKLECSEKKVSKISDIPVTSICFLNEQKTINVSQFFGIKDSESKKKHFDILFSNDQSLYFMSYEMSVQNIKKLQTTSNNIFIIMDHGYIQIWKSNSNFNNSKFVEIPHISFLTEVFIPHTNKSRVFALSEDKIFITEHYSITLPIIMSVHNEIIKTVDGIFEISPMKSQLKIKRKSEDLSWIFEPAMLKLGYIHSKTEDTLETIPSISQAKKSIRYKELEHPIVTLISKNRSKHKLNHLKGLIAKSYYKRFLNEIEKTTDKEIDKSAIIVQFIKIIYRNEPSITQKHLLKNLKSDILSRFLIDTDFLKSLFLYANKSKFIKRRLHLIYKKKKKLIETICSMDMVSSDS